MNRKILIVICLCTVVLFLPNVTVYSHATGSETSKDSESEILLQEAFDPVLFHKLKSMDDLVSYIDASFTGDRTSYEFVNYIWKVISLRFYHSYSFYSTQDNWTAAIAGRFVWKNLSAVVLPDDILKYPNAACSQQSIVLMECARRLGLDYRKVGFQHHYATEIRAGNKWYYVDPDMEVIENKSFDELYRSGYFFSLYENKKSEINIDKVFANQTYGKINEVPAENARIFHKTAWYLSEYFICILFLIQSALFYVYCIRRDRALVGN